MGVVHNLPANLFIQVMVLRSRYDCHPRSCLSVRMYSIGFPIFVHD
jgi:hypothetical protein